MSRLKRKLRLLRLRGHFIYWDIKNIFKAFLYRFKDLSTDTLERWLAFNVREIGGYGFLGRIGIRIEAFRIKRILNKRWAIDPKKV